MACEETDPGEVLTKCEELFGSLVEHEVIKMVLQSCEWNFGSASEIIMSMIDPEQLPAHVRSAVIAGTVVRGGASNSRRTPERTGSRGNSQKSSPSPSQYGTVVRDGSSHSIPARSVLDVDATYYSDGYEESNDVGEEGSICDEIQDLRSLSRNEPPTRFTNVHNNAPSGRASHSSILTPFAMAQGAIAREPSTGYGVHNKLYSMTPTLPLHTRDEEKEIVDALPSDIGSNIASPQSSLQATAPILDFESSFAHDSSEWVSAPEFVATAPLSFLPQEVNYGFSLILDQAVQSSNGLGVISKAKQSKKEEIVNKILSGRKILVLMRGLPGSGKSTLAKEIKGRSGVVLSADDFFNDKFGKYNFEPSKLRDAHAWNMNRARMKLQESRSPIIIDNTNIQTWEMQPYVRLALQHGYDVDILEPETSWKFSASELALKTIHGVPKNKIKEMMGRYDHKLLIGDIIHSVKGVNLQQETAIRNPMPESHHRSKTDWPTTLPDVSRDKQKVKVNGEIKENISLGLNTFNGISYQANEGTEQPLDFPSVGNMNSLTKNGPMNKEEEEEGPDVIIEGYEDLEETDFGATARENIFITENQESLKHNDRNKVGEENKCTNSLTMGEVVTGIDEHTELQNEERIRAIIEEANTDNDVFITDWDDLAREATEEEIELDEEKFLELVNTFGSSIKYELEKAKGCNENGSPLAHSENTEDIDEDSAMYDLCSNVEEKLGQSLSSAIIRPAVVEEPFSLFSIINTSELEDSNGNSDAGKSCSPVNSSDIAKDNEVASNTFIDLDDSSAQDVSVNCNEIMEKECTEGKSTIEETEKSHFAQEISFGEHSNSVIENCDVSNKKLPDNYAEHEIHKESMNVEEPLAHTNESDEFGDKTSINPLPLSSWECVKVNDGEFSVNWETKAEGEEEEDSAIPKPTRDHRRRTSGDPNKWLLQENESTYVKKHSCSWEPVSDGASASWEENRAQKKERQLRIDSKPLAHTGAVPKTKVNISCSSPTPKPIANHSNSVSPVTLQTTLNSSVAKNAGSGIEIANVGAETQTLSIDFQALELDNNLYELKILYGQPNYVPACGSEVLLPENGPLTKGKLVLDKGTMTENIVEVTVLKPLKSLVAFFPNIPETELKDVLEKCKFDLDWAMNVLLDGGYKMAEQVKACDSQEDSDAEDVMEPNQDGINGYDASQRQSSAFCNERVDDLSFEERTRKLRQSQQPDDLNQKRELENSFIMSETVDDRITRLTGKDFDNLNITKIKKKKSKKKHSKKKQQEENINWAEGEGAQYVTLVMDPLFASQLISMFGPIGSCGMSGDMVPEDRSVILPLEFCHQIHKYWTNTLDGKFNHEAEVLDSLIREDENLARRLQEEEVLASKTVDCSSAGALDDPEKVFELDPPSNFQEIMDLEKALQESQGDRTAGSVASMSSHLSLQRLYTEFPHVDREALKQEFNDSGFNYQDTLRKVANHYGYEQSTPKNVIAPELLIEYEQQQIMKATKLSLEEQELQDNEAHQHEEEAFHPDDPQIYRDEAQTHYLQRQECYRKAQEAHRRGMKTAAAYYASIGKLHSERLCEANERASVKILEAVNAQRDANVLDLHLLHVPEALIATQAFLSEREQVVAARCISHMQVSLITGHGAHSLGGQAKLKPAIKDFLLKRGYSFQEGNIGMFVVTLRNK